MSVTSRNRTVKMPVGMLRSFWAPITAQPAAALPTYGDIEEMGAARTGTLAITTASADIYGDDVNLMHFEEFVSYTLTAETTLDELEVNAKIYGHTYASGISKSSQNDSPPYGGYAFVEPIIKNDKSLVYRATFLIKLSANPSGEAMNAATKEGTLTPRPNQIVYTGYACNNGEWREQQEFSTESAAVNWLLGLFGYTPPSP